jgi:undecaprenyl-diphosphatase
VKLLVARPRPAQTLVEGVVYSYPSGHVLEALSIFGIIGLLIWRSRSPRWVRIGVNVVFAVLVVIVGIARVSLAAHYPSDVLGGAIAGIAVLATFAWLTSHATETSQERP